MLPHDLQEKQKKSNTVTIAANPARSAADRLIICNWKMHGNTNFVKDYCQQLDQLSEDFKHCRIVIAPPAPYWNLMKKTLRLPGTEVGAQHIHHMDEGAFTGDISLNMALDCGLECITVGHSECRKAYSKIEIAATVKKALQHNMRVVVCVGDNISERKASAHQRAIIQQLEEFLPHIPQAGKLTIAYEPIWAIGTNLSANSENIREMQGVIAQCLVKYRHHASIIYGGSVNEHNAHDIIHNGNMDGLIIGNASLSPQKISLIARTINQKVGEA